MNKKYMPYLLIIIVIAIIWVFIFIDKTQAPSEPVTNTQNDSVPPASNQNQPANNQNPPVDENLTLMQEYAKWNIKSIKCNVETNSWWVKTVEAVYMSWKNIRTDVTITSDNKITKTIW